MADPADREAERFYDALADDYDGMVDIDRRVRRAAEFVGRLVHGFDSIEPAVDVGCGTGAYTLALAEHGLAAVGVDLSSDMLQRARQHAAKRSLDIDVRQGSMTSLSAVVAGPTDLLLCLGNTIPHLLDPADLDRAFAEFARVLRPGGIAAIQLLNYDRILSRQERIVSIDRAGNIELVRFYDFLADGLVRFNLLRIDWTDAAAPRHSLRSVPLRPYRRSDLADSAQRAGMNCFAEHGGLDVRPFDPAASDTLLLLFRTNAEGPGTAARCE